MKDLLLTADIRITGKENVEKFLELTLLKYDNVESILINFTQEDCDDMHYTLTFFDKNENQIAFLEPEEERDELYDVIVDNSDSFWEDIINQNIDWRDIGEDLLWADDDDEADNIMSKLEDRVLEYERHAYGPLVRIKFDDCSGECLGIKYSATNVTYKPIPT